MSLWIISFCGLQAALDFSLVCKEEHIRSSFEDHFPQWAHAYCRDMQIRSSSLQKETADYSVSMDDGMYSYNTLYVCMLEFMFRHAATCSKHQIICADVAWCTFSGKPD